MASNAGKAFLADAERDYHAKRDRLEQIELPIMNADGEPWVIHFRAACALRDTKKIDAARERGGLVDMAVEALILRACDQSGDLMFDKGDRFALTNKMDAEIALQIATEIGGYRADDVQAAEKNSEAAPS